MLYPTQPTHPPTHPPRSGLFYLRANERTVELLTRLETRLSKTKYWDQTAFNEEVFFLSHGAYKSPQVG
jgi:hypothetical protein